MAREKSDSERGIYLRLVRVDPQDGRGIRFMFESAGVEHRWLLETGSVTEMIALLFKGRLRSNRRVLLGSVEVSLEPPESESEGPSLCLDVGHVEVCVPVDKAAARALRADLGRFLKE